MHSHGRKSGGIGFIGWLLIILGLCATLFNLALYYKITHVEDPSSSSSSSGEENSENNNNDAGSAVSTASPLASPDSDKQHHKNNKHHRQHDEKKHHHHHEKEEKEKENNHHDGDEDAVNDGDTDPDGGEAAKERRRQRLRQRHHQRHHHGEGGNDAKIDDGMPKKEGGGEENDNDHDHHQHHQKKHEHEQQHEHEHHRHHGNEQEKEKENPHHQHHGRHHGKEQDHEAVTAPPVDAGAPIKKMLANQHKKHPHHNHDEHMQKQWDNALQANTNNEDQNDKKKDHHHHGHNQHHNEHHDHKKGGDAGAVIDPKEAEDEKKELEEEKQQLHHRLHEKHKHHHHQHQNENDNNDDNKNNNDNKKEEEKEDGDHHHQHQKHHHHNDGKKNEGDDKNAEENRHAQEQEQQQEHHEGEGDEHHKKHRHHNKHHNRHHHHNQNDTSSSGSADADAKENNNVKDQNTVPPLHNNGEKGASEESPKPKSNNNNNNNKKLSKKEKREAGRKAFHVNDQSSFSSIPYDKAYDNFANWTSKQNRLTNVEQSSNHFEDIIEQANMGVLLPEDGDGFFDDIPHWWDKEQEELEVLLSQQLLQKNKNHHQEHEGGNDDGGAEGGNIISHGDEGSTNHNNKNINNQQQQQQAIIPCDPDDADFTPEKDRLCVVYLRNPRNWVSIKVMSSILSTGRTIKFKVFLKHPAHAHDNDDDDSNNKESNQNNNKNNKNKYIAAIVKVSQKKFLLEPASEVEAFHTDRFLGFNKVPPVSWTPVPLKFLEAACGTVSQFYSNWFLQFVEENRGAKTLISKRGPSHEHLYLNVSLQLWMNHVHDADTTSIRPSMSYEKYLKCDHGGNDNNKNKLPEKFVNPSMWTETKNISLSGLVDVSMFDYIIGNSDRWFGHNMFALEIKNDNNNKNNNRRPPSFIFLDQGSSFYSRAIPAEIIYHRSLSKEEKEKVKSGDLFGEKKDDANTRRDLCRVRKSIADRIVQVGLHTTNEQDDYFYHMRKTLPSGIFHVGSPSLLKAVRTRIRALARMIEDCKKSCPNGERDVYTWE